ncbi:MAG: hypothetical protein M9926_12045 [Lentimicrobium sp.]|uniref:hypothetical protein n=1 Tax=Lentimicrobium sp. TaxID=2034841 RepID=UPI0025E24021|nr:hypothetical protein [Lentimicrobium sp.]MCO5257476.1 hypothetical protein [Lentimicrobium sp.]
MRKLFVIVTTFLLSMAGIAQNGFYLGYENGGLFERYNYVNSKANTLTQASIGGIFGGYFGFKYDSYTVETGFYGLSSSHPLVDFNYSTSEVSKSLSMSSGQESWLIPLRFGKEFLVAQNKIFIKPEIGFNVMISRDYSENQPMMGWGENVSMFPGDNSYIPTGSDSTRAYGYIPSKINFSIEPGISSGYRFKEKADIYLKCSYIANFNPSYYETITHYSETGTVYATRNMSNSILFQIGLKYYFAKRE